MILEQNTKKWLKKGIQTSAIKRKLGFPSPFMFSFVGILNNISSLYNKTIFYLREPLRTSL